MNKLSNIFNGSSHYLDYKYFFFINYINSSVCNYIGEKIQWKLMELFGLVLNLLLYLFYFYFIYNRLYRLKIIKM